MCAIGFGREWFHPVKSELQAVSLELAVERRLRRAAEEKLRRAEDSRRAAERERDLLRVGPDIDAFPWSTH